MSDVNLKIGHSVDYSILHCLYIIQYYSRDYSVATVHFYCGCLGLAKLLLVSINTTRSYVYGWTVM
jgi:hypothetical protein